MEVCLPPGGTQKSASVVYEGHTRLTELIHSRLILHIEGKYKERFFSQKKKRKERNGIRAHLQGGAQSDLSIGAFLSRQSNALFGASARSSDPTILSYSFYFRNKKM